MQVQNIAGALNAAGMRTAIVAGRFNSLVSEQLISGALDCLTRHGAAAEEQTVIRVPGAFEIPFTAKQLAQKGGFDAIICVGAVIRGSTPHFDFVANEAAKGIAQAGLQTGVPIIFGVITTNDIEQALERAGTKAGNKGWDAALSAIEMADLTRRIAEL
ncbi:6,7-dimethyl-8-ribityllumazine synthase [Spirochaeta africana]|uniref:6,7-dimethyl-8-ribityllumazine synthase n=1 Tax=Spirochaeta africana (strain ATCC 700263 / DSM 8902 / Z-7692) TaxID=889378 RepID=H9UIQ3_SPIAZ|nr:6,7-dimethyl-8-ribityllumazine synthase [Spirochaeta africana]AFG37396.1 6,7-dimethyl-8-ribityllumazine synthase [Spirochaeta africana DSM 8902]